MKIALGIPLLGHVDGEAFGGHVSTAIEITKTGHELVLITPNDIRPHDAARQLVVDEALKMGCELLYFIDADTINPRGSFLRLLTCLRETKAQVVSGLYMRRGYPYTPVWCAERAGEHFQVTAPEGWHELVSSGLGSALIDLQWCREHLSGGWFKMESHVDERVIGVTDDMVFFRKVREAGGKLMGNADVRCTHVGPKELITCENADALRAFHLGGAK